MEDYKFIEKLNKLRSKEPYLFIKNKTYQIAKMLGYKNSYFSCMLSKLNINSYQEKEIEFVNYIYSQDKLNISKIAKDLNLTEKTIKRMFVRYFGVTFEEFAKSYN